MPCNCSPNSGWTESGSVPHGRTLVGALCRARLFQGASTSAIPHGSSLVDYLLSRFLGAWASIAGPSEEPPDPKKKPDTRGDNYDKVDIHLMCGVADDRPKPEIKVVKKHPQRGVVPGPGFQLQFNNLKGPWMRQKLVVTQYGWSPDCPDSPNYECKLTVRELFRLRKDKAKTAEGEIGETTTEGTNALFPPHPTMKPEDKRAAAWPRPLDKNEQWVHSNVEPNSNFIDGQFHPKEVDKSECPLCTYTCLLEGEIHESVSLLGDARSKVPDSVDAIVYHRETVGDPCFCPPEYERLPIEGSEGTLVCAWWAYFWWNKCPCRDGMPEPMDPQPGQPPRRPARIAPGFPVPPPPVPLPPPTTESDDYAPGGVVPYAVRHVY